MTCISRCAAVVVPLLAAASIASAQPRSTTAAELGIDGQLAFTTYDIPGGGTSRITDIALPLRRIRIGLNAGDVLEWEPFGSLSYTSGGGGSATTVGLGLGALWHLNTTDRSQTQWYLRPFADVTHVSTSGNVTGLGDDTQWGIGAGVGAKLPIADRFAARLEGNFDHHFKGDHVLAFNRVALLAGLSFYTH